MKKLLLWGQPLINRISRGGIIVATHNVTPSVPAPVITNIVRNITGSCEYPAAGTCTATSEYEVEGHDFTVPYVLEWTVSAGATITAGQGTHVITVTTTGNTNTTYDVTCTVTDAGGTDSMTKSFTDTRTEVALIGSSWTLQDTGYAFALFSVSGNENIITALPGSTSGARYSTDGGVNWQSGPTKPNIGITQMIYGDKFVAVGDHNGGSTRAAYSTDGINWLPGQGAASNSFTWPGVCYGNGQYVAVANNNTTGCVITSPDGITWTTQTHPINRWTGVAYGNGVYVAIARQTATGGYDTMTSPDGANWTIGTQVTPGSYWESLTFGAGKFVALSSQNSGQQVLTSTDGITWTQQTTAVTFANWSDITYTNGQFVAVAGNRCMTSPDGINWTNTTVPTGQWQAISYVPEQNKAVSVSTASTVTTRAMTSP